MEYYCHFVKLLFKKKALKHTLIKKEFQLNAISAWSFRSFCFLFLYNSSSSFPNINGKLKNNRAITTSNIK